MEHKIIIGFGYKAGSGKDTCATYLSELFNYTHLAFAKEVKRVAKEEFGWDGIKNAEGRKLLQSVGALGRSYNESLWIDKLADSELFNTSNMVVISDLRYPNEVSWVKSLGGQVIIINRSGGLEGSAAEHESETSLDTFDDWDFEIDNSGSIEALYMQVDMFLSTLKYSV